MARIINLDIDQGTTFSTTVTLQEDDGSFIDLTGFTGAAQIRKHPGSNVAVNMTVSLAGNTGAVTLALPASASANMAPGLYVYDVIIVSPANTISRPFQGNVFINPGVTR